MFTGDPGVKGFDYSPEERERTKSSETPYKRVRKRKTDENPYKGYYSNSKYGTDPNRYRAGVLSVGFGPLRIDRDSEKIRHTVQNKFANDIRWN